MIVRRTALASAAVAAAAFLLAAPIAASAAPGEPCFEGTLVAPGVCEVVYTAPGSHTFTPRDSIARLEILLVGAGGSGADQTAPNTNGFAAAGGGGEVLVVEYSAAQGDISLFVGTPGSAATSADEAGPELEYVYAAHGESAGDGSPIGGASGNANAGAASTISGGGGSGGATSTASGGAGVVVGSIAGPGSLFDGDGRCFGGGGAAGGVGVQGVPGCGGGGPVDATGTVLAPPAPHSGGGGGGLTSPQSGDARGGADGMIALRYNAANVTLTFDVRGIGTAPAAQSIVPGTPPLRPVDPTASGYVFRGWFVDEALSIPADLSAPIVESTTFYAAWGPALPATGSRSDAALLPSALGALVLGAAALAIASRARRRA